jgi:hypothetical protein
VVGAEDVVLWAGVRSTLAAFDEFLRIAIEDVTTEKFDIAKIPRGRLTLDGLAAGSYDLRYRNLSSGGLSRSPAFILEEVPTARGTQHSAPTVRLYESGEGRMDSYALGEADF